MTETVGTGRGMQLRLWRTILVWSFEKAGKHHRNLDTFASCPHSAELRIRSSKSLFSKFCLKSCPGLDHDSSHGRSIRLTPSPCSQRRCQGPRKARDCIDVPQASNPWTFQLRNLELRDLPTRSRGAGMHATVGTCSQIANSVGIARQAECWILSFGRAACCFSRFRAQGCGSGFQILMQPWGSSLTCSL